MLTFLPGRKKKGKKTFFLIFIFHSHMQTNKSELLAVRIWKTAVTRATS